VQIKTFPRRGFSGAGRRPGNALVSGGVLAQHHSKARPGWARFCVRFQNFYG